MLVVGSHGGAEIREERACHERKGGVKERSPGGEGEGYVVTTPPN